MGAGRSSGSKVVGIAVAGTVAVAGIGTLYLPFMADRDQMRGMDEAGGMSEKARQEMQAYLKNQNLADKSGDDPEGSKGQKPGSMWSNMKK